LPGDSTMLPSGIINPNGMRRRCLNHPYWPNTFLHILRRGCLLQDGDIGYQVFYTAYGKTSEYKLVTKIDIGQYLIIQMMHHSLDIGDILSLI